MGGTRPLARCAVCVNSISSQWLLKATRGYLAALKKKHCFVPQVCCRSLWKRRAGDTRGGHPWSTVDLCPQKHSFPASLTTNAKHIQKQMGPFRRTLRAQVQIFAKPGGSRSSSFVRTCMTPFVNLNRQLVALGQLDCIGTDFPPRSRSSPTTGCCNQRKNPCKSAQPASFPVYAELAQYINRCFAPAARR